MSPVRYELDLYIPKDGILHSRRCENLKSYTGTDPVPETLGFLVYLEFRTMYEAHKPSRSDCFTPSSEPLGFYLKFPFTFSKEMIIFAPWRLWLSSRATLPEIRTAVHREAERAVTAQWHKEGTKTPVLRVCSP
jgi:hypothetical protein